MSYFFRKLKLLTAGLIAAGSLVLSSSSTADEYDYYGDDYGTQAVYDDGFYDDGYYEDDHYDDDFYYDDDYYEDDWNWGWEDNDWNTEAEDYHGTYYSDDYQDDDWWDWD